MMLTIVINYGYRQCSIGTGYVASVYTKQLQEANLPSEQHLATMQDKTKLILVIELGGGGGAHVRNAKVQNCDVLDVLPHHGKQSHIHPEWQIC